ncbi:MAG: SBBP repeat-containing protein, partial [Opitutaceae bacterium]|nr:SBBP repeat-containing protein [Verrucomicrobiales bacterium]
MKHGIFRQQRLAAITLTFTSLILSLFAGLPLAHRGPSTGGAIPASASRNAALDATAHAQLQQDFGKPSLSFEANQGQTDRAVKFTSRGRGYSFFLTANEAVMQLREPDQANPKSKIQSLKSAVVRMQFNGANASPQISGIDPLPGKSNFFIGNDRRNWHADVPNFAKVNYTEIYPGVDLVFYGNQRQLEYDFVVAPGADAGSIGLSFAGAEQVLLDEQGNLVIRTTAGEIVQHAPVIYQETDSSTQTGTQTSRQNIPGGYVLTGQNQVAFQIGDYDHGKPLVIDPVLSFASYLGGSGIDKANGVAVDGAGNVYLTGITESTNFPATGDFSSGRADHHAVFITKLNPTGSAVLYSTLIDGKSSETGLAIAVDETGSAYATGSTGSRDFPLQSPFQDRYNPGISCPIPIPSCVVEDALGGEPFVLKLNPAGDSLIFSTYLGGAGGDAGNGIAVSADHKVYVAGDTNSRNFPVKNEFQNNTIFTGNDAFLSILAADGQSLVYSTYLLGTEGATSVAVDAAGNAYIAGRSDTNQLSVRGGSGSSPFRSSNSGGTDAFVAKFNPAASGNSSLVYATYLGGGGTDSAFAIAVDNQNQAYVTGVTGSFNFPLQAAAGASVLDSNNQVNEAFVTCLNANASGAVFSTFLGGAGQEEGLAITLDRDRNIIVAGDTTSGDFARVSATQQTIGGGRDAFVTKIAAGGTAIRFSTFLGGSGNELAAGVFTDGASSIYLAGNTSSTNFPVTPGVLQTAAQGAGDGFTAKIAFANPDTPGVFVSDVAIFGLSNTLSPPNQDITVFFGQALSRPIAGDWDGDGVTTVGAFKNGVFQLTNTFTPTPADVITINFGQAGDIPVAGDWDGDGVDTIGLFRPAAPHQAAQFLLRLQNNTSTLPRNQVVFNFGGFFDFPVVGDWDGDGSDSVGVFHGGVAGLPGEFRLVNENSASATIFTVSFGVSSDIPVAGDWDGDGVDTVGVFKNGTFRLRLRDNNSTAANNNLTVTLVVNSDFPLAGDWN